MHVRPGQTQTALLILSWPPEYIRLPHQMPHPTLLIDISSEPSVGGQVPHAAPKEHGEAQDPQVSALPWLEL